MSDIESRLYRACRDGHKLLVLSLISKLVGKQGYNRFICHNYWYTTPLHEACRHGWLDVVQLLVKKVNHDIDVTTVKSGKTPLHISCKNGQVVIVRFLTKHGCNPILRNFKGKEPLDYALDKGYNDIVHYLCTRCITSAMMLAPNRIKTTLNILNKVLQDKTRHFDWKMSNGDSIVETVCYSKLIAKYLSQKNFLKLVNHVQARIDDKSTDIIPQIICRDASCVSYIPSVVMMEWLGDTTLDPMKLVISCNLRTADGDTLFQLVCKSESCVKCITSTVMLKWLNDTTMGLMKVISVPNYKTTNGDTLLQLVCKSEACVSCISSTLMLKWLADTTMGLMKVISVPNYRTADGDTLLQLVCQSELCVSHISSTIMLKWLVIDTTLDFTKLVPNYKTAEGHTLFQLICQSELCVSRISSTEILKWLINTDHELMELNLVPNYKTADGDTLLKLVCQTESCVSRISSTMLKTWLKQTNVDLLISGINWKTADGNTVISIIHQLSEELLKWLHGTNLDPEKIVSPNWKTADGDTLLQLVCQSESCVSRISSTASPSDGLLDLVFHSEYLISQITSQVILSWLNTISTKFTLVGTIVSSWKTKDGDSIFKLSCTSHICLSHISSSLMLQWLNDVDTATFNILKSVHPDWTTGDGDAILHLLCKSSMKENKVVELLQYYLQQNILNPSLEDSDGNRALHLVCTADNLKRAIVRFFVSIDKKLDINDKNKGGLSPLGMTKDPEIMERLVQHGAKVTSDVVFNIILSVKEHKASEILLLSITKKTMLWKPTDVNDDGNTALHLACKVDKPAVVKYLLTHRNCIATEKNLRNELPIELTVSIDTVSLLLEHGATMTPELVLKFAATESIPNDQLAQLMWNPNIANSDGNTALHLACQAYQPDTVNFLLSQAHCDPNIKNKNEEIPLQMTTNSDIIKDLIRHGARTNMMYESHRSALGTNEPIKPPVKIFVVGNPSVGKSTLTAALKKTLNFVARWFTSGKVSGVEKKTVGIIPHKIESDIFGRVTVYDFAGHREFYSGHAALLKAAIQSTPPVFLLVVNLLDGDNEIIQNILYWISFLENQCTLVSCKPHLIIVGSHADTLKSKGVSPQENVNSLVNLLNSNHFINLEFIGFIPMDCQLHESAGMDDLRPLLVRSCSQLRIQEPITFNAHCFLVYLLETFKDTPAVTISTIREQIEKQLLSYREGVLDFLPKSTGALYKICLELNERGHILFLRDNINLENSYVVVEEKSLLSEVSGTVFASEDFKQYKRLASNTGVVSLSKLEKCFPGKDINIVIGFLTHLEFCHEISNQGLAQLISKKYSPNSHECYYLFPALILQKANFKDSVWDSNCVSEYHFGWILQCAKYEQFFSSRFLQVLLLRLAFSFALESSTEDSDNLGIHRKCSLWKNGISWGTHFEMNIVVEINDNKFVIVMCRFNTSNLVKCLEHRSQVLHTVLECVEEFCPRTSTVESFVDTSSALEYPFELNSERTLCNVKDLAEALVSNCVNPSVVLPESGKWVTAQSFISFEPYTEMEVSTLQELLDINNDNKVVSDVFVSRLVKKVSNNLPFLIKIFNEDAPFPCSKDNLYQEILKWRDISIAEPKTYSQLRKMLDQHSVFAGRNIMVSIVHYSYIYWYHFHY